jgi:hypothetical protein
MRLEYAAGERMFVDFAGDTVPVIDAETGRTWQAHVFVSVLGASGYLYAEATRSQDLASCLGAHVRALEFYSGSARAVVPDYVPRHIIGQDRAWRVPSPLQLGRVPHLLRLTVVGRVVRKIVRMRFPSVDEERMGAACILARQLIHRRKLRLAWRSSNRPELDDHR